MIADFAAQEKPLMRVPEVAESFEVDPETVRVWMREGKLRARSRLIGLLSGRRMPICSTRGQRSLSHRPVATGSRRCTDRDGEPVELSWSYYPLSLVSETPLTRRGRIPGGVPRVLAELGYPEREFIDQISARPPTTEEAEELNMPAEVPVIRQFRVIYSYNARPVEVSVIIKPSHLYELRYRQVIPVGG